MKAGAREIVCLLLILTMMLGAWWFIVRKIELKRQAIQDDIRQRQSALESLRVRTAGIENLEEKLRQLQQAIRFFESKLPPERDLETILTNITRLADKHNLVSRSVGTTTTERGPAYSEQQLKLSLSGDFDGFYSFLLDLEKLPRITRLNRMDLKKINDREGQMEADLLLSVFFEPDPSQQTAAVR